MASGLRSPGHTAPHMRYSLRATISIGEKLMITSTEYIDPFAGAFFVDLSNALIINLPLYRFG